MKQTLLQEKYPVYTLETKKSETRFQSVDEIIDYLKTCVDEHPKARFISFFDHYQHTSDMQGGEIAEDITAAKHIVFCFGTHLPNPYVMAVRPRSIGVVEQGDEFVVSFLEAPMPLANNAMEAWVRALADSSNPSSAS
ncbi:DUF6858 family protein [Thiorhodovibrio frisius]|uniref:Uncharacterized protein n=1 Tax=Thiorhodovibrio frisius TaxID=631362 RepID=H8Z7K6_9GAMM|nr:hypothetical protein [Thiorhodovibrio frisius]EIC20936.1 hypothetical protein Thi970DRAFT_04615 [Thiorhodovibrio frisius]WPL21995.1 hypothetical protein Thiofri_02141 [Thiorhodovibrio frisius]